MICPNCNREIPDGSSVCGYCSADLRNMGYGAQQGYTPPQQQGYAPSQQQGYNSQQQQGYAPSQQQGYNPQQQQGYNPQQQQMGYDPQQPYQPAGGYAPDPIPQQSGASGFGLGGRFKFQITPRGLMVMGGVLVVLILLIWLLVSIFGGGENGNDNNTNLGTITQPTPLSYPMFNETAVPADYVPEETADPLGQLPLAVAATATPVPTAMPTFEKLGKGDEGPDVVTLQTRLKYFGFLPGDIDGQYGPATSDAVKKFQEGANLSVDGVAGNDTLRTLYSLPFDEADAAVNPEGGATGAGGTLTEKPDIPG